MPWRHAVRDVAADPIAAVTPVPGGGLSVDAATVLGTLAADEAQHIDDVIVRCGMAPARVGAMLMSLELAGRVRQLEGQRWIVIATRARRT